MLKAVSSETDLGVKGLRLWFLGSPVLRSFGLWVLGSFGLLVLGSQSDPNKELYL